MKWLSGVTEKRLTEQIKGKQTALPAVTTKCFFIRVPRCCPGIQIQLYFIDNLAILAVCDVKYSLAGLIINFTKCCPTPNVFTS